MSENTGRTPVEVTHSEETKAVLAKLAHQLDGYASNVRANNHNVIEEWDGIALGYERAATYIRLEMRGNGEPVFE